jgi:hypothetical protein
MTYTHIKDIDAFLAANADRACTFEDMGNSLYSDIYKDAYGFRPRHTEVPFATVGDLYAEIDRIYESAREDERLDAERYARWQQEEKDAHNLELIAAERDWLTIS